MENKIALFEKRPVRRHWDEKQGKWYFSVVDIIFILTGSSIPKRYWSDLKSKLQSEGSQVYDKIVQLKLAGKDGKKYLTDVADVETIFRLVQSVPSPKAEPIKLWLAKVGQERIQEISDPEKSINRGRENWRRLGRSEKWIQQRMMGQETRNKLTDYWKENGVKGNDEFAILTNIIHEEWSGLTVKQHKELKNLKNHNLRDHMSEAELIFTALAELSTRQIAETMEAKGMEQNKTAGKQGGRVAKKAKIDLESKTGKKIVSGRNFLKKQNSKRLS